MTLEEARAWLDRQHLEEMKESATTSVSVTMSGRQYLALCTLALAGMDREELAKIGERGASIREWSARLDAAEAREKKLREALEESKETIRSWHGMQCLVGHRRDELWAMYQHSPEMTRINAALGDNAARAALAKDGRGEG